MSGRIFFSSNFSPFPLPVPSHTPPPFSRLPPLSPVHAVRLPAPSSSPLPPPARVQVDPPTPKETALVESRTLISLLFPAQNGELVKQLEGQGATMMAMDCIPRCRMARRTVPYRALAAVLSLRWLLLLLKGQALRFALHPAVFLHPLDTPPDHVVSRCPCHQNKTRRVFFSPSQDAVARSDVRRSQLTGGRTRGAIYLPWLFQASLRSDSTWLG